MMPLIVVVFRLVLESFKPEEQATVWAFRMTVLSALPLFLMAILTPNIGSAVMAAGSLFGIFFARWVLARRAVKA